MQSAEIVNHASPLIMAAMLILLRFVSLCRLERYRYLCVILVAILNLHVGRQGRTCYRETIAMTPRKRFS